MTDTSAFPVQAPTDELEWLRLIGSAPEADLGSPSSVVVVAPHPDDETLAVGGTLAALARSGVPVTVVTVTDGEGSHPGRAGLVEERTAEQRAALEQLGVPGPAVRIRLPDGGVADHGDELDESLVELCPAGSLVLAPWAHDGHTDHDAAGESARRVVEATGARLLSYPVWAWQWARPQDLPISWLRRRTLARPEDRAAKARAVACYRSQIEVLDRPAIVGPDALPRFFRPWEVLFDER
ncbi:PIG-L family deacetylase [soil metagenome]